MRFMIIVKANADSEAGVMPGEALLSAMQKYHEELTKAGVLVDANGLQASSKGWRIRYAGDNGTSDIRTGDKRTYVDGPFAETKELIAGYTIINVKSLQDAIEWTKRFPNPAGDGKAAEIEVRQLFELEDFDDSPAVDRFREMDLAKNK